MGHQDDILADLAVVRHLHEVVDLAPAPDHGDAEGGAVDRGVRADLHVVLDPHPAHLGDLAVGAPVEGIAEAVGAQHRAGVDDDAVADLHPVAHDHPGIELDVLAEAGALSHEAERAHPAAPADARASLHDREGPDRGGLDPPRRPPPRRPGDGCRGPMGARGGTGAVA